MDINNYVSIDKLVLVYQDAEGALHRQPGWEVAEAGPMLDADTDEELSLVGFILADERE